MFGNSKGHLAFCHDQHSYLKISATGKPLLLRKRKNKNLEEKAGVLRERMLMFYLNVFSHKKYQHLSENLTLLGNLHVFSGFWAWLGTVFNMGSNDYLLLT